MTIFGPCANCGGPCDGRITFCSEECEAEYTEFFFREEGIENPQHVTEKKQEISKE